MYTAPFEYHAPASLDEALSLLREHGDDAKLLAGGHSLIPVMKLRFAQPKHIVDLRKVPGLVGIREEDGALVIGAMTTYAAVRASDLVDRKLPVLAEAVGVIGDPLVRNMGTVGGSLAHADPGADLPALALALDAELRLRGRGGPARGRRDRDSRRPSGDAHVQGEPRRGQHATRARARDRPRAREGRLG